MNNEQGISNNEVRPSNARNLLNLERAALNAAGIEL